MDIAMKSDQFQAYSRFKAIPTPYFLEAPYSHFEVPTPNAVTNGQCIC